MMMPTSLYKVALDTCVTWCCRARRAETAGAWQWWRERVSSAQVAVESAIGQDLGLLLSPKRLLVERAAASPVSSRLEQLSESVPEICGALCENICALLALPAVEPAKRRVVHVAHTNFKPVTRGQPPQHMGCRH